MSGSLDIAVEEMSVIVGGDGSLNVTVSAGGAGGSVAGVTLDTAQTITGAKTFSAPLVANSIEINGGTIDGTVIGGTNPAAGAFTSLSLNGDLTSARAGFRNQSMLLESTDSGCGAMLRGVDGPGINDIAFVTLDGGANDKRWVFTVTGSASTPGDYRLLADRSGSLQEVYRMDRFGNAVFSGTISHASGTVAIADHAEIDGNLTIDGPAAALIFMDASASGESAEIYLRTNGSNRWAMSKTGGAETGSDAGSDWVLARFDDAGVYQDTPLIVSRNNGKFTVVNDLQANGNVNLSALPTSSAGLSAGDLWNDSGTLKVA